MDSGPLEDQQRLINLRVVKPKGKLVLAQIYNRNNANTLAASLQASPQQPNQEASKTSSLFNLQQTTSRVQAKSISRTLNLSTTLDAT